MAVTPSSPEPGKKCTPSVDRHKCYARMYRVPATGAAAPNGCLDTNGVRAGAVMKASLGASRKQLLRRGSQPQSRGCSPLVYRAGGVPRAHTRTDAHRRGAFHRAASPLGAVLRHGLARACLRIAAGQTCPEQKRPLSRMGLPRTGELPPALANGEVSSPADILPEC